MLDEKFEKEFAEIFGRFEKEIARLLKNTEKEILQERLKKIERDENANKKG